MGSLFSTSPNCPVLPEQNNGGMAITRQTFDDFYERLYREIEVYTTNPSYDKMQQEAAEFYDIDWLLAKAVRIKESHDNPYLISNVGAVGLMQLMPREGSWTTSSHENYLKARKKSLRNAERTYEQKSYLEWGETYQDDLESIVSSSPKDELYKKDLRFDPEWNIGEGTRELAYNIGFLRKNGFDQKTLFVAGQERPAYLVLAVAAYNAGLGTVLDGNIPKNPQTSQYVPEVFALYDLLKEKKQRGKEE